MEWLEKISEFTPRQRRINRTRKESGPQGIEKEINFDDVTWILNYKRKNINENFICYQEEQEYIQKVENFISSKGLNKYIKIKENDEEEYFARKISLIKPGYKITFRNLHFIQPYYKNINMHEFVFTYVAFKNNIFSYEKSEPQINEDKPKKPKNYIHLLEYFGVRFENNKFIDVGLSLAEKSEINWEPNPRYNPHKFIILENNIIPFLYPGMHSSIEFKECNIIDRIDIYNKNAKNKFNISWSMHQEIDLNKKFYILNKEFFIAAKKVAVENNDKLQETLINREIIRCDDHSIRKEESWINSWQDRLIMWFGRVASNHGVSWIRPIIGIVTINLLLTSLASVFIHIEFWRVFIDMFNPLSSLPQNSKNYCIGILLSITNIIQKGIFALLVYELIRVGRRFVAK